VFNLVPQLQKSFPAIGAAGTASLSGISAIILFAVLDLIYSRLPKQWKVVIPYGLCLGAMNLILSRHRAYSHWTGSDTGIYRPITGRCFLSKRFVDYLWVLLAAAGMF
jgi:inner membrane transporter RhtA